MRGAQYRDAIRTVLAAFGPGSKDFVFLGSCVLGLYRRPSGGSFRQTIDADVASTVTPWSIQEKRLADLCTRGVLEPDIVSVATEVLDLADRVRREDIRAGIRDLWRSALDRHQLDVDDIDELVRCHLHPIDAAEEDRVVETLVRCARGA